MTEFINQATPYLITIIIALVAWFYQLLEKGIHQRYDENKLLTEEVAELKIQIAGLNSDYRNLKETQKMGFDNLERLIKDRMESLEKLLKAEIKNR